MAADATAAAPWELVRGGGGTCAVLVVAAAAAAAAGGNDDVAVYSKLLCGGADEETADADGKNVENDGADGVADNTAVEEESPEIHLEDDARKCPPVTSDDSRDDAVDG